MNTNYKAAELVDMKAIVCVKYEPPDDVLELKKVEKPHPNDGEVLEIVNTASCPPS